MDTAIATSADESLLHSEAIFRVAFDEAPIGVAVADTDLRLIRMNREFCQFLGYSREELLAMGVADFTHPEDLGQDLPRARRLAAGQIDRFTLDKRYIRKDKQVVWGRLNVRLVRDPSGRPLYCLAMIEDITEHQRAVEALRRSEARYRLLHEGMRDAFVQVALDGRITDFNDAYCEILGYTAEEIRGLTYQQLTPQRWHAMEDRIVSEQILARGYSDVYEKEYRRKDGTVFPVELRSILMRGADGQPNAMWAIVRDITERKRTEESLAAAKQAAEAANRAKDQFIAVLSHELRTPLTPAVAALGLLRTDGRLPHDVLEDLQMVSRNIDLEVRLIADLLDVSRIISGKLHLEKRPMDVALAIREAAAIVSGDLDAKGQKLVLEMPGTPYLAHADAARLQQVFWNLLRNAIKFSPERSTITLRARVEPTDLCPLASHPCIVDMGDCPLPTTASRHGQPHGGNLVVEVIDNGIGIAPDMLPRLFNAFAQEGKARAFGGLGLGLSICKAVVEVHGGTITACSDGPGAGATFTVRLWVAQCPMLADIAGPAMPDLPVVVQDATPVRRDTARLLLVEDHADTATLLQRMLFAEGHDVTVASSIKEALAAVAREVPDVLISDLGLPDGNGFELLIRLRAMGHNFPAIALSGYGTPADLARSKAAGFAEHLVKPLSGFEVLTGALTRLGFPRGGPLRTLTGPPQSR